jgi:hypothetical protein
MKNTLTVHEIRQTMDQITKKLKPTLENLYFRWEDEKEFEDFNDYKKILKGSLPSNCHFINATKKPFAVVFNVDGAPRYKFRIIINQKHIQWKAKAS